MGDAAVGFEDGFGLCALNGVVLQLVTPGVVCLSREAGSLLDVVL